MKLISMKIFGHQNIDTALTPSRNLRLAAGLLNTLIKWSPYTTNHQMIYYVYHTERSKTIIISNIVEQTSSGPTAYLFLETQYYKKCYQIHEKY